MRTALQSASLAEEQSLYESASRRVHDTVPVVPLLSGSTPISLRYNVVGVAPSPIGMESYRLARLATEGSTTVTPENGGAAGYSAGSAFTSVDVPPGALPSPVVVTISPSDPTPVPAGMASAGHAFNVETGPAALSVAGATLAKPAVLTVEYASSETTRLRERSLQLYIWDGAAWTPASATCSPATEASLDTLNRRIAVPVCQFGRFALFGERPPAIYLPILRR